MEMFLTEDIIKIKQSNRIVIGFLPYYRTDKEEKPCINLTVLVIMSYRPNLWRSEVMNKDSIFVTMIVDQTFVTANTFFYCFLYNKNVNQPVVGVVQSPM